ncbi:MULTISPECIES: porin [unclassified Burkholderia]|uniref:porin n=1 Tax=unclassified Burkholderia TaxID=2613784 RepID=UPI0005E8B973|nr:MULTISPECIES: porin [unclassified Burkholderia]TGN98710.1 porin [Burkholderia sp. USMB20]
MKWTKTTVGVSTFALASLATPVHAQSSVTLYGVISTGVQYVSNVGGASRVALVSGGMMPPRFGLRGDEDLGGGTHAVFTLENGFAINTGAQVGGMFGRQAFVGVRNDRYGTVTMGRQYEEMTASLWWAESANVFTGIGTHIGDNDNMFFTNRFNNSIRYQSPSFSGVTVAGSYAFSNTTVANDNNGYSVGVNYARDRLRLGGAFTQFNRRTNSATPNLVSGAVDSTGWGFTSPFVLSQHGAGTDQQRIFGLGATYDFDSVNVIGNYSNVLFNYSDGTGLRLQNAEIAAYTRLNPMLLVGTAYIYTWGRYSGGNKPRWHQIDFSVQYALSKRTDLFATAIYQHAAGDATFAQIYSIPASSGKNQLAMQVGMRHRF